MWAREALVLSYLTGLPLQFMRSSAGWGMAPGSFFLPRASFEPPEALKKTVFPWIEEWEGRVRLCKLEGKTFAEGGLDQGDIALDCFMDLMKYLRVVLLQDLAVLQPGKCVLLSELLYSNYRL
jgi:hypothetical protein